MAVVRSHSARLGNLHTAHNHKACLTIVLLIVQGKEKMVALVASDDALRARLEAGVRQHLAAVGVSAAETTLHGGEVQAEGEGAAQGEEGAQGEEAQEAAPSGAKAKPGGKAKKLKWG